MRKRHAARPVLELMEQRLTLSVPGAIAATAEVHVTRLTRLEARKAQEAAAHATKHDATTKHQTTAKHAKTTKSSSTSSSFSSAVSSFFKSALGGL